MLAQSCVLLFSFVDWEDSNVGKGGGGFIAPKKVAKSAHGLAAQIRTGEVQVEKKYGGANSSAHSGAGVNMRKLEESEVGVGTHEERSEVTRRTMMSIAITSIDALC